MLDPGNIFDSLRAFYFLVDFQVNFLTLEKHEITTNGGGGRLRPIGFIVQLPR